MMKAKIAVSEEDQSDPRRLAMVYDDMAAKFSSGGLCLPAVSATRQYYSNLNGPGQADPLSYNAFPAPLPPGSVRLCVVFFQKTNPKLAALVYAAAQEVMSALPPNVKYHLNDPGHYHITTYMTSQPHTLRPNPFDPDAALPSSLSKDEVAARAAPTEATVAREVEVMRTAAAETPAPTFCVHRILMADSGTLLLCNVESTSVMTDLRRRLKEAFPGGPPRQSTIFHASLARVLGEGQLSREVIDAVQAVCDRWSHRLRGEQFKVAALHHVMEEKFTTVDGPAVPLAFKGYHCNGTSV